MQVTYLGTTMLLFDDGTDQVLFDCHVTRPSLFAFLFRQVRTDTAVADRVLRDFPMDRLRGMVISHSHSDHAMDMPYFANKCGCRVYGSASTLNIARGGGVPEEQLHCFAPGEVISIGAFSITVLASVHSKPSFLNNNLGQTIDAPLPQPTMVKNYKEGGSFDFLVEHDGRRYLIRPSYNFVPGQLDGIQADVLFLGVAGLAGDDDAHREQFWRETVDKVQPELVIPLHWDNFFTPLYGPLKALPKRSEDTGMGLHLLALACSERGIDCAVQLPLTKMKV